MKKYISVTLLLWMSLTAFYAQEDPVNRGLNSITGEAVKAQLDFLASDWTEGRETGERGIDLAADYIASMFRFSGLEPAAHLSREFARADVYDMRGMYRNGNGYFQDFALMKAEESKNHELAVISESGESRKITRFNYATDFAFEQRPVIRQEGEFPVVFAGYGLVNKDMGYDDYKNINVRGKVVLRLVGYPGHRDTTSEAYRKFRPMGNEWTKYRDELDRNDLAIEKGAVAVIVAYSAGDVTVQFAKNVFRYNYGDYEGDIPRESDNSWFYFPGDTLSESIPAFTVTRRLANELTANTKVNLDAFEEQVQQTLRPTSEELQHKKLYFKTTVKTNVIRARNILAMIEGENSDEILVIGGHYDHLGKYNGYVYNGSDDNASGTVAVMSIARACMATGVKPRRTMVFAAWTAEEVGLLGSEYFVSHPPAGKIITYLNFDMISRDSREDSLGVKCSMTYTQSCKKLEDLAKQYNQDYQLGLQIEYKPREKPTGGSDHNPFVHKDIPIYYFMAGWHEDFHKPRDHSNKANVGKMTRIIKLGFLSIWDLANIELN